MPQTTPSSRARSSGRDRTPYNLCLRPAWEHIRPYGRYIYYAIWPERRPEYFRAPWRYPVSRLDEHHGDRFTPGEAGGGSVFLFLPMVDWHGRFQRSQQMARVLAELGHTCIYVNPQLGAEYLAPYAFDASPYIGRLAERIYEVHVHLPRVHESHARGLTDSEVSRVVRAVGRALRPYCSREVTQIVSFPRWLEVAESLRALLGSRIVYDCHDYLPGFGRISDEVLGREDMLLETSDLVVFSSERLRSEITNRLPEVGPKSVLIRNAVRPSDFAIAPQPPGTGEKPIVGYAGALESWFDVELVRGLASKHTDCVFQLIGGIENTRVFELERLSNVELAGEVRYGEIGAYMSKWSAALIPFIKNQLTDSADLIKLYEYFSLGLPVVSTALDELQRYRDLVYMADDADSFSRRLAEALSESGSDRPSRRRAVAAQETWLCRAAALLEALRTQAGDEAAGVPQRSA